MTLAIKRFAILTFPHHFITHVINWAGEKTPIINECNASIGKHEEGGLCTEYLIALVFIVTVPID